MDAELRRGLEALLAAAIGTLAGILADSGFTIRESLLHPVFWLLGPAFDLFSAFPNAQLVLAGVVERLPVILILGLGTGLLLRHVRYRRLLLWTLFIWPLCVMVRRLAGPEAANGFVPQLVTYAMQFALLVIVMRATDRLATRPRHAAAA
jgi:hypothetical protein